MVSFLAEALSTLSRRPQYFWGLQQSLLSNVSHTQGSCFVVSYIVAVYSEQHFKVASAMQRMLHVCLYSVLACASAAKSSNH